MRHTYTVFNDYVVHLVHCGHLVPLALAMNQAVNGIEYTMVVTAAV